MPSPPNVEAWTKERKRSTVTPTVMLSIAATILFSTPYGYQGTWTRPREVSELARQMTVTRWSNYYLILLFSLSCGRRVILKSRISLAKKRCKFRNGIYRILRSERL